MALPAASDQDYGFGLLLGGSLRILWQHRRAFARAAAVPLALLMLQAVLNQGAPLQDDPVAAPQAAQHWPVDLLQVALVCYAVTLFGVAWWRFLLGYGLPPLWPGFDRAQLRTFARVVLLSLPPVVPLLLIGPAPLPPLPLVLAAAGLGYLALRCSLVLPAAAVGVPLTLPQSWRLTAGRSLPLFFAPLCGSLVIGAVVGAPLLMLVGFFVDSQAAVLDAGTAFVLWTATSLAALIQLGQMGAVLAIAVVRLVPDPLTQ